MYLWTYFTTCHRYKSLTTINIHLFIIYLFNIIPPSPNPPYGLLGQLDHYNIINSLSIPQLWHTHTQTKYPRQIYDKLIWGKGLNVVFAFLMLSLHFECPVCFEGRLCFECHLCFECPLYFWMSFLLLNVVFAFCMLSLLLNVVFAFDVAFASISRKWMYLFRFFYKCF
jgi:hypothetical protein